MAEEADVIGHLLEVEREASEMLLNAQKQADEKIAQARAKSDKDFLAQNSSKLAEIDASEKSVKQSIDSKYNDSVLEYKSKLESCPKDVQSFNSTLEKYLFVEE